MVLRAHRNFPFPNVNVVDADVTQLPFRDNSFDMAVSFSAFDHFSNQQKALDEIHRVLKPDSMFYIIHLHSSKEISEIHHQIGGIVSKDVMPPPEQMQSMLETSHFKDIVVEDHPGLYLASAKTDK
jgi:ubiquinone/menaquinone biosynthesis C-methylase UbiE